MSSKEKYVKNKGRKSGGPHVRIFKERKRDLRKNFCAIFKKRKRDLRIFQKAQVSFAHKVWEFERAIKFSEELLVFWKEKCDDELTQSPKNHQR